MVPCIAMYHEQFDKTSVICLHAVKGSNNSISNNSVKHKSTKLNGSMYCYVS